MKRSALVMVGLILVLAGGAWLVMQRPGESSRAADTEQMLVTYDSAAVDRLVISSARGTVVLEQQAGRWMLREPIAKQSLFQLDSTGTLVRVFERGTEKAVFHVGKPSTSNQETYVRADGSDDVYLTRDRLSQVFSKAVREWRDRTIFKGNPQAITSVGYRFGDTTFVLAFKDSIWRVDGLPAAQSAIPPLLNALANLQGDGFIDTAVTTPMKLTASIAIGSVEIRFFEVKGALKYLVQSSASPQWFEVQQYRTQQILKRKLDLLPPT
jgi:hypothetical protein